MTPSDAIREGLRGTDQGVARRNRRVAADFQRNEQYEELLALRDSNASRWDALDKTTQLRASMYESQRQVAADQGADNPPPAAA
ncbi:MAG: hypothetical protein H0V23_11010 [Nocardioidaceae bacterium]|nr:hypothetical protein [Nocardioidaceae bacterium]